MQKSTNTRFITFIIGTSAFVILKVLAIWPIYPEYFYRKLVIIPDTFHFSNANPMDLTKQSLCITSSLEININYYVPCKCL